MLPSPPLTEPDVPISSIRFFTGELRSQWRIDGRSGREGVDVASELLRGVSMGACPFDPFAITTYAKCVRLRRRTSAVVQHYLFFRSRHSGPAPSRSEWRAGRELYHTSEFLALERKGFPGKRRRDSVPPWQLIRGRSWGQR